MEYAPRSGEATEQLNLFSVSPSELGIIPKVLFKGGYNELDQSESLPRRPHPQHDLLPVQPALRDASLGDGRVIRLQGRGYRGGDP